VLTLPADIRRLSMLNQFGRRGACWLVVLTDLSAAASIGGIAEWASALDSSWGLASICLRTIKRSIGMRGVHRCPAFSGRGARSSRQWMRR
jgi:hypothetical protein